MNKKLLISLIVVVALLSIRLNFANIYNYFVWYIPLSKINNSQIVYVEKEEGGTNGIYSPTMRHVRYINDNSVEITLGKTQWTDFIPNNFEFIKTVHKGDAFIAMCRDVVNGTTAYLDGQLFAISGNSALYNTWDIVQSQIGVTPS